MNTDRQQKLKRRGGSYTMVKERKGGDRVKGKNVKLQQSDVADSVHGLP